MPHIITCTTTVEVTTMSLPATQKAAVKVGTGESSRIEVKELPVPEPSPDQILVKVNYSGLCASDKSLLLDEWESTGLVQQPCTQGIAGHEGAGTVVAVGSNGTSSSSFVLYNMQSMTMTDILCVQSRISGRSVTAQASSGSPPSAANANFARTGKTSATVQSSSIQASASLERSRSIVLLTHGTRRGCRRVSVMKRRVRCCAVVSRRIRGARGVV